MDFSSVHNVHEPAVFEAILDAARNQPELRRDPDLLADVACVALNRLPARYIRHGIDFAFCQTEQERLEAARQVATAVAQAFDFVRRAPEGRR